MFLFLHLRIDRYSDSGALAIDLGIGRANTAGVL